MEEAPVDPAREIVDPHHHLWDHGDVPGVTVGSKPFLLQDFMRLVDDSGQKIVQTVYVECHSMYRREGPLELRSVGETEFANGMAAMSASGRYGTARVAAGIVGTANLRLGTDVAPILEAQIAAGNGRLKGIRFPTAYADSGLFGRAPDPKGRAILLDPAFREGVSTLQRYELTLDVWCLHSQLEELAELASVHESIAIVLDHLGTPLKFDAHLGRDAEVYGQWRSKMMDLARRPNVVVKLGGLGMDVTAPIGAAGRSAPSSTLANEWRPYVETCIEAFGAGRCMFESNFPVDKISYAYGVAWNAFKRLSKDYSTSERAALFHDTAARVYRIAV
jgi:L-fuconolactonase